MLVFGALALAALYVKVSWAATLVALALIAHAGWDLWHLWRRRVVAASYAEFCWVLDVLLGTAILVQVLRS